jgi:hypothetical protein
VKCAIKASLKARSGPTKNSRHVMLLLPATWNREN